MAKKELRKEFEENSNKKFPKHILIVNSDYYVPFFKRELEETLTENLNNPIINIEPSTYEALQYLDRLKNLETPYSTYPDLIIYDAANKGIENTEKTVSGMEKIHKKYTENNAQTPYVLFASSTYCEYASYAENASNEFHKRTGINSQCTNLNEIFFIAKSKPSFDIKIPTGLREFLNKEMGHDWPITKKEIKAHNKKLNPSK